jgi:biotin carboxyl carrier protein
VAPIVFRLRITINGRVYEATVEELEPPAAAEVGRSAGAASPPAEPPAAVPAPGAERPGPGAPAGREVRAPLPGVVADVRVRAGQAVDAGQVVVVLEAMKMDNEVVAPVAGRIADVRVARGQQVAAGEVLVVIA